MEGILILTRYPSFHPLAHINDCPLIPTLMHHQVPSLIFLFFLSFPTYLPCLHAFQVRADYAERKRITKKRKSRGEEEEDDDEGEITRATRRAKERMKITAKLAKKVVSQETKSKAGSNNGSSSSSSNRKEGLKAPRMYELADGISSSKATFSHTAESREKRATDRAIGAVPLLHRLSASDASNTQRSKSASRVSSSSSSSLYDGGGTDGTGSDFGGQEIGKVKYLRTEEEGLVRAFSYIPQVHHFCTFLSLPIT